jgi:hypothetical protein
LRKRFFDGHGSIFRARSLHGMFKAPLLRLLVQVIQVMPLPSGKETVAYIANCSFNSTFFIASRHGYRARLETVMSGQVQQGGMKADGVALALKDSRFEVVILMWRCRLCAPMSPE